MQIFRGMSRFLCVPIAAIFFCASVPLNLAHAGLVPTDQIVAAEAGDSDRARVQAFLDREDVRNQMQALGVDPADAAKRVATLSDAEIAGIANRLDTMPAGQSTVGFIVGTILFILLVALVLDLLGVTNIFPFINPVVRN